MTTRTYRQTRRADATERTRAAILVAARELFREDPQFDPSLEALAERAGVSTRTVIRQFGSKEGVLEEAITAGVEDAAETRHAEPGDGAGAGPPRARRRGPRDRPPLRGDGRRSDALAGARRSAADGPPRHRTRGRDAPQVGRRGPLAGSRGPAQVRPQNEARRPRDLDRRLRLAPPAPPRRVGTRRYRGGDSQPGRSGA